MSQPAERGVIHDIGYRHYDGPRLGRGYLVRSLYVESLKGAFGLGRSAKSKVMPAILLAVMVISAFGFALAAGVTGASKLGVDYRSYPVALGSAISLFTAAQAPASVSRDLRFKVMPLYLSRPLTRAEYVLAKYAAMASALFVLMAIPLLVLYVGALLGKLPFWAQTKGFTEGLAGAVLFALVIGGIGLVIASITPRRGFGVAAVIAVLLVATIVTGVLQGTTNEAGHVSLAGWFGAVNPFTLVDGVQVWLFGVQTSAQVAPPGRLAGFTFQLIAIAEVVGCYALLRLRYRRVSAS